MNNELQKTALMLLGKACLHGLVSEEDLTQRLENLSGLGNHKKDLNQDFPNLFQG